MHTLNTYSHTNHSSVVKPKGGGFISVERTRFTGVRPRVSEEVKCERVLPVSELYTIAQGSDLRVSAEVQCPGVRMVLLFF